MDKDIALLGSLPIERKPGYSLSFCIEIIEPLIARTQKTLKPSFFKRAMGGISKDHNRTVVAACNEDLNAVARQISKVQRVSFDCEDFKRGSTLSGFCERLSGLLLEWRNAALAFEANTYGSDKRLLIQCNDLMKAIKTMEKPVKSLVE